MMQKINDYIIAEGKHGCKVTPFQAAEKLGRKWHRAFINREL